MKNKIIQFGIVILSFVTSFLFAVIFDFWQIEESLVAISLFKLLFCLLFGALFFFAGLIVFLNIFDLFDEDEEPN